MEGIVLKDKAKKLFIEELDTKFKTTMQKQRDRQESIIQKNH